MRIKIVATLGPASMDYEIMKEMAKSGVRVFRLNFSHSDAAAFEPVIKMIRQIESELDMPLTAMGDLCGPKTRIGEVEGSPLQVHTGSICYLGLPDLRDDPAVDGTFISLDFPELLQGLEKDMPVSLSDGMLRFNVERVVKADKLFAIEAQNSGILTSHKGIAFPGKSHPIKAMTAKDRKDLHEGLDVGIDAVALSFVQTKDDILDLKNEIEKHGVWIPVVAKLERTNAYENLDDIVTLSDVVMVARGDLGLEAPLTDLPVIQKRIIRSCRHHQKASIVATQMMLSMVNNPMPTRAEITDVANAILDGADCVMLSEETAIGKYPLETVRFIQGVAQSTEEYYLERSQGPYAPKREHNPAKYLAYAATLLADSLESSGLICHSTSGATARLISSRRPGQRIYALTPDNKVLKGLNFFFGVEPALVDPAIPSHLERAESFVQRSAKFKEGDSVVITSGQPTPGQLRECHDEPCPRGTRTNQIKIYYK